MQVLIDINWRPVFFEEEGKAKELIHPYVEKGDILKMSDEEAEWLYNVPRETALHHPEEVRTTARIKLPPHLHLQYFETSRPAQNIANNRRHGNFTCLQVRRLCKIVI